MEYGPMTVSTRLMSWHLAGAMSFPCANADRFPKAVPAISFQLFVDRVKPSRNGRSTPPIFFFFCYSDCWLYISHLLPRDPSHDDLLALSDVPLTVNCLFPTSHMLVPVEAHKKQGYAWWLTVPWQGSCAYELSLYQSLFVLVGQSIKRTLFCICGF